MKRNMLVSLIGRPNVGKSSLFNRLMNRQHKALTYNRPGVTRDRHYGIVTLQEGPSSPADIILVDTGGFYPQKIEEVPSFGHNTFFNLMAKHIHAAIEESDLILLIMDIREGLLPADRMIADIIRAKKKPFWPLLNKYDTHGQTGMEAEFYSLGAEPFFLLSAAHGRGVGELKEQLYHKAKDFQELPSRANIPPKGITPRKNVVGRLALIGAPNSGKSTLLNHLLRAERALVSDVPGTTVDPIEGFFDLSFGPSAEKLSEKEFFPKNSKALTAQYRELRQKTPSTEAPFRYSLHLVDTAGIRRKSAIQDPIESQSVFRSLRCMSESDIVLFLVDATHGIGHQDRRLVDIAWEKGKSIIFLLNKIDLLKQKRDSVAKDLKKAIPWLPFCDFIPISAKYGHHLKKLHQAIIKTVLIRHTSLPTARINQVLHKLVEQNPIALKGGKRTDFKLKYASMKSSNPPTFLLFTNRSKNIPENYKRYLKKGLRREFLLDNTPIHLLFKTRSKT